MPQQSQPVALVTGASRGIGAAIAHELAQAGYALALVARSAEALQTLVQELATTGVPTLAIPADLRDPAQAQRVAMAALAHYGRVDVLINNAGIGTGGRTLTNLSPKDVSDMLALNLEMPILLSQALLPQMLARRSGSIIMLGSVAGRLALPGASIYSASKYGLRGFTHSLRREVRRSGIGVTLIAPGFIKTDMTSDLRGVPMPPPAAVARAVLQAIRKPERERILPVLYRAVTMIEHFTPWLVDAVLTSRKSRSARKG